MVNFQKLYFLWYFSVNCVTTGARDLNEPSQISLATHNSKRKCERSTWGVVKSSENGHRARTRNWASSWDLGTYRWKPSIKRSAWRTGGARCQNYVISFHLHRCFLYVTGEGSGMYAHLRRFVFAFVALQCDKCQTIIIMLAHLIRWYRCLKRSKCPTKKFR